MPPPDPQTRMAGLGLMRGSLEASLGMVCRSHSCLQLLGAAVDPEMCTREDPVAHDVPRTLGAALARRLPANTSCTGRTLALRARAHVAAAGCARAPGHAAHGLHANALPAHTSGKHRREAPPGARRAPGDPTLRRSGRKPRVRARCLVLDICVFGHGMIFDPGLHPFDRHANLERHSETTVICVGCVNLFRPARSAAGRPRCNEAPIQATVDEVCEVLDGVPTYRAAWKALEANFTMRILRRNVAVAPQGRMRMGEEAN